MKSSILGGKWVEWQSLGAPGWWHGIHDDPLLEVRARSLALLRAAEDDALRRHQQQRSTREDSLVVPSAPITDVRLSLSAVHRSRSQSDDGDPQPWGVWTTEPIGLRPVAYA